MKADVSHEQRFVSEIDGTDFASQDLEPILRQLSDWRERLTGNLKQRAFIPAGMDAGSVLALDAGAANAAVETCIREWPRQWASLDLAHVLADVWSETTILLVFGKFNAGKSSLCNFLAERFAAQGKPVRYFRFEAGRIVDLPGPLKEGATETTAQLQGVRLGEKLVLLDTPGLHSVTPENAALTKRFTESADGVLWLTSSASPGQVQELDELSRELRRAKPLLPVITRSDLYEEDEVDGELVRRLRNKTPGNRADQEADVQARAREKLVTLGVDVMQLKPPISVSVYMARNEGQSLAAMEDAGFERLYTALRAITGPAAAYKRRKPAETLLHHLEENVLGTLREQLTPLLETLRASSQSALAGLERQQEQVTNAALRTLVMTLPEMLEKHSAARDVDAVRRELSASLSDAFTNARKLHLPDYETDDNAPLPALALDDIGYEELAIENEGRREVIGSDYSRLYKALEAELRSQLFQRADAAVRQCRLSIEGLMAQITRLEEELAASAAKLDDLKAVLRAEAASA